MIIIIFEECNCLVIYIKLEKQMKKIKLIALMCLVTIATLGQVKKHYVKNNVFYTTFETGIGQKVPMRFNINSIKKITTSEFYKYWLNSTSKDAKFLKEWKSLSNIEKFLMDQTFLASFYARTDLTNKNSYTPLNGESTIEIDDFDQITIMFPLKAQNEYGNFIIYKAYYVFGLVDGKEKNIYYLR